MADTPQSTPQDLVEAAGMPVSSGVIEPQYDPRLTNEDLAPLKNQHWGSYNIFAFWMSDVHSVGGYVTAGSLFALGCPAGRCWCRSWSASRSSTSSATWSPSRARKPACRIR